MNGGALWLTMLVAGVLTYSIRLSFILLLEHWKPPELLQRGLRFVPPAVLTAIIFPEMVMNSHGLDFSPLNPRLLAGILAALVSWRSKNMLLSIATGMAALLLLQSFILPLVH